MLEVVSGWVTDHFGFVLLANCALYKECSDFWEVFGIMEGLQGPAFDIEHLGLLTRKRCICR